MSRSPGKTTSARRQGRAFPGAALTNSRDEQSILRMRDAGRSWDQISERLGLSIREAKSAVEEELAKRRRKAAARRNRVPDAPVVDSPAENLAARIPQVARRARVYRLEDNGASKLAQRKRDAKSSIYRTDPVARHERAIAAIEARQAGLTQAQPLNRSVAEHWIRGHRRAIRAHLSGLDAIAPTVKVIAPITRRVAREDRRRKRRLKGSGLDQ